MLIREIELRNVKSYKREKIEFLEGVNGIIGENGAGKSTILEAIGYVLFDHIPYRKDEFLRKGEKTGEVVVWIESEDGIYEIRRGLGKNTKYSVRSKNFKIEGKKDVLDLIKDRIFKGVLESERLSPFFEQLVGVPQGTFNSLFMMGSEKRKIFNEILRIDEYDKAFDNLREVRKRIEVEIGKLEGKMKELRIRLEKYPQVLDRIERLKYELAEYSSARDEVREMLGDVETELESMEEYADELAELRGTIKSLEGQRDAINARLEEVEKRLQESKNAYDEVIRIQSEYEEYLRLKDELEKLEAEEEKRRKAEMEHVECLNRIKHLTSKIDMRNSLMRECLSIEKNIEEIKEDVEREKQLLELLSVVEDRLKRVEDAGRRVEEARRELEERERI
ncbi:hypothetical protein DRN72_00380 [Methanosarcinales archaeon]|nr:MAG: hypothetical protein DRN72_00380 [Methanosarcinales archaeon]